MTVQALTKQEPTIGEGTEEMLIHNNPSMTLVTTSDAFEYALYDKTGNTL